MTKHPERWNPQIGARVDQGTRDQILALRGYLGGIENATISATLRELIGLALAIISPDLAKRVAKISLRFGWERNQGWRQVVEAGLAALEQQVRENEESQRAQGGAGP